jgi:hypothetical protein
MQSKLFTVPSIDNFLDSMGDGSLEDLTAQLATYAKLGYYFDGTDRSGLTVRKLRKFVAELDQFAVGKLPGFSCVGVDDDDLDLFQVVYQVEGRDTATLSFRSPTLANSFKPVANQAKMIRLLIDRLGEPAMLELPYLCLPVLVEQGGKAAGFL